ncbi:MAG: tRNA lysidine(34) synthetase TilS [Actinomycetota bacterium]|nr:tRNA lysidine(34) synthetase TilS [Actinomycetota bacterium]
MPTDLVSEVNSTIAKYSMLKPNDKVLVSVSGGPDSVCLLQVLSQLAPRYQLSIHVFHLDHVTRRGQSRVDARFVKDLCADMGLNMVLRTVDAARVAQEKQLSFQEAARKVRLSLLTEAAAELGCSRIALGHNADDRIETVLMNLFRGSGTRGLSGIKPVSGNIVRPLIETWRNDILNYLAKEGIDYCLDSTNVENKYRRNRIRNLLLPFIQKNIWPNAKPNILRAAETARLEDGYLSGQAEGWLSGQAEIYSLQHKTLLMSLNTEDLGRLHPALQRRVVIEALGRIRGYLVNISSKNIEGIIKIAVSSETRQIQPCREVLVIKQAGKLYFINNLLKGQLPARYSHLLQPAELEYELKNMDGSIQTLPGFGLKLQAAIIDRPEDDCHKLANRFEAFLDYGKIRFPVKIRNWEKGDRFKPLGLTGDKKLQDFFTDLKIPGYQKSMVPIFVDKEKIIWVGGHRVDHRARITSGTKKVLHIKIWQD